MKFIFLISLRRYGVFTSVLSITTLFVLFGLGGCTEQLPASSADKVLPKGNDVYYSNLIRAHGVKIELVTDVDAFAETLYPLLTQNCALCHGDTAVGVPRIASSDLATAYADVVGSQLVNLTTPENSAIVAKVRDGLHNCWTNCPDDGIALQTSIANWAGLSDAVGGKALYDETCSGCHGVDGQGTPGVIGLTRPIDVAELTQIIETRMPPADPSLCTGSCAILTAQYIFDTFNAKNGQGLLTNPTAFLPKGPEQIANVCARLAAAGANNVIRDAFCGAAAPTITSLRELQRTIGLEFTNPNATGRRNNGRQGNPAFTLIGHSSSLVARFTSAINPRAVIFTPPNGRNQVNGFIAMGFLRGDQFAEIVVSDRNTGQLSFFLVEFAQACNLTNSCTPGELLTPAVERNWIEYTVYDQQDLANTIFDCLQCHQPAGPGTRSILRMQELRNPWTHFFRGNRVGGRALLADFTAAHGTNEEYAGIPPAIIPASDPALLENLIRGNGFGNQPNEFPSARIEREVVQSSPAQPGNNDVPGASATWQNLYNATVQGQFIAVPYHDVKVTDSNKLAAMTQAYQSFTNGTLAAASVPDIRDVFLDVGLRDMGFKVQAGLSGQGIITQACTQCHNSTLDQSITRARFNVNLNQMSDTFGGILTGAQRDAEIGITINRLRLPAEDIRKMPPDLFRTLDPAEIDAAVVYLCSQTTTPIPQCN